jgi:hypothetical protein
LIAKEEVASTHQNRQYSSNENAEDSVLQIGHPVSNLKESQTNEKTDGDVVEKPCELVIGVTITCQA